MSPGRDFVIVVSGTRESEQPMKRIPGCWPAAFSESRSGSVLGRDALQHLLRCRAWVHGRRGRRPSICSSTGGKLGTAKHMYRGGLAF